MKLAAHGLKLAARNACDADDADGFVGFDEVDELVDLFTLPLRDDLGLPNLGFAHAGTSTDGPIVVFT